MRFAVVAIVALTLGAAVTLAQGHQGAMGVWVLNVQQSKFDPGPLPKVQTSTFTQLPDGSVKIENDSTDAQGRTSHREMLSKFDGRQEDRAGSAQPTSRAYRWIDDLNFEFEEMINGERSVVGRTTMSKDGNVRTLTVNGTRNGMPVHNIEVYERQRPAAPR
jgi:predicted ester cyclase